jgi:hypothetical protein
MPARFFQDTIALVYDFDGTLSPQAMQEYTVLPKIGIEPARFWAVVNKEAHESRSDPMLVYMRHIIEALEREKVDVKREDFARMASAIAYFPGVSTWFSRMNGYVARRGKRRVKLAHYLISAGQKEILEGVPSGSSSAASTPRSTTSTTTASRPSRSSSSPTPPRPSSSSASTRGSRT